MQGKFISFIKVHWIGVSGLLIGLVGIILSVYFYSLAKQERQPAYVIDPSHVSIIDSLAVSDSPLIISDSDGRKITGDVSLSKVYFWNAGNLSIRKENVLESIRISIDSGSEIIDYRVIKTSRSIVRPELNIVPESGGSSLELSFDILEGMDGVAIQIVYLGKPSVGLSVTGIVEGVPAFLTNQDLVTGLFWQRLVITVFAIILLIAVFRFAFLLIDWFGDLRRSDKVKGVFARFMLRSFTFIMSTIGLVFVALILILTAAKPVMQAKEEADKTIVTVVPPSLTSIN